jgi:hypothetical protein
MGFDWKRIRITEVHRYFSLGLTKVKKRCRVSASWLSIYKWPKIFDNTGLVIDKQTCQNGQNPCKNFVFYRNF